MPFPITLLTPEAGTLLAALILYSQYVETCVCINQGRVAYTWVCAVSVIPHWEACRESINQTQGTLGSNRAIYKTCVPGCECVCVCVCEAGLGASIKMNAFDRHRMSGENTARKTTIGMKVCDTSLLYKRIVTLYLWNNPNMGKRFLSRSDSSFHCISLNMFKCTKHVLLWACPHQQPWTVCWKRKQLFTKHFEWLQSGTLAAWLTELTS